MFGPKTFSVLIFITVTLILFITKPKRLVDQTTGEWKQFGIGEGKTCINITFIVILLAIIAYFICKLIKALTKRKIINGGAAQHIAPPNIHTPIVQTPTPIVVQTPTSIDIQQAPQLYFPAFGSGFE